MKNKLIKKLKSIKEKFSWRRKYKELKKEYDKEVLTNNKLLQDIDNLELLLDMDYQARRIEELEALVDNYRETKHLMRNEILDLRKKLKEKQ